MVSARRGMAALVVVVASLGACTRRQPSPNDAARPAPEMIGAFAVTGELTERRGDTLEVVVMLKNTSYTDTLSFDFGECAIGVRVYRPGAASDKPAWDQDRWNPGDRRFGRVCLTYLARDRMPPRAWGNAREFTATLTPAQILGDSLPAGTYHFTTRVRISNTTVVLDLGDHSLSR